MRSFDLTTGASKLRRALPGEVNLCNDFTLGPDHSLYVSDSLGSRIWRLKPDAQEDELLIEDRTLDGIDGITVTTLLDGLKPPTAIEPSSDTLWVGDRGADKAIAIPQPR